MLHALDTEECDKQSITSLVNSVAFVLKTNAEHTSSVTNRHEQQHKDNIYKEFMLRNIFFFNVDRYCGS